MVRKRGVSGEERASDNKVLKFCLMYTNDELEDIKEQVNAAQVQQQTKGNSKLRFRFGANIEYDNNSQQSEIMKGLSATCNALSQYFVFTFVVVD